MKIGFSKTEITPPMGMELAGYAGYRPCSGMHDPLYCKAAVLEQMGKRYGLLVLDLMCADESLYEKIAQAVAHFGISRERLIVAAIHSHAAPRGCIPGQGPLHRLNNAGFRHDEEFAVYIHGVVQKAAMALEEAVAGLEPFRVRTAQGELPPIGSERHTGQKAEGSLTVLHFQTASGRNLMIYNLPCQPTVLSSANLEVSADFAGQIEKHLHVDMGMFVNGAAGDISTRFTRREQTFAECERLGAVAARAILELIRDVRFQDPSPLTGNQLTIPLEVRQVETVEDARRKLEQTRERWEKAASEGADPATLRILKSYVEGAGVSLEFAQLMGGLRELELSVSVFRFMGLDFVSIPGELFSTLLPGQQTVAICYANGYDRYIASTDAYDKGYYEAMAAVLARGQGERLQSRLEQEINQMKQEANL